MKYRMSPEDRADRAMGVAVVAGLILAVIAFLLRNTSGFIAWSVFMLGVCVPVMLSSHINFTMDEELKSGKDPQLDWKKVGGYYGINSNPRAKSSRRRSRP